MVHSSPGGEYPRRPVVSTALQALGGAGVLRNAGRDLRLVIHRPEGCFVDVSLWLWLAVLGLIVAMLAVDLFAHRRAHVIGVREAAAWSAVWVAIGVAFGAWVWAAYGAELGQQYFAGYLIEKSLAVDNVFVWAIIFTYFAVPREYQHRVLFLGVLGALVFRGLFIAGGSVLIASFGWVLYLFAAFLLWTGWRMLRQRNEHIDPARSRALRLFRRYVPMTDAYQIGRAHV